MNPSKYWIVPKLQYYDYKKSEQYTIDFNGNNEGKAKAYVPNYAAVQDGLEFEQGNWLKIYSYKVYLGIYKIMLNLYADGSIDDAGKGTVEGDILSTCSTKWIAKNPIGSDSELKGLTYDDIKFLPGKL